MKFFRLPFASKLQIGLLIGMILGFVLIAQNVSFDVYRYGLIILTISALLQIVVGNIPPETRLLGTLSRLAIGLAIVTSVFVAGAMLVPFLAQLGSKGVAR
jgi:uncharacterized membrane protein (DUF441 family)